MRNYFLSWVFIFCCFAQSFLVRASGCRIDFYIKGYEKENLQFGYQHGDKQIITDSIFFDEKAHGFYESKTRLIGGIYVLVFPNKKYLEFVVNEEQYFSLITDTSDILGHLIIEGSEETDMFRQYQVKATQAKIRLDNLRKNADSLQIMNEQVYNSELSLQEFRHNIISKFPKSFLAAYFRMMEEPQMPQTIKNNNTEPLKNSFLQKYQYLKQHYFENFDFNDIRLLRTSMIYQKLEYYFNKLLPQSSDTLIESINSLVEKTNKNNEYYKFFVSFFLSNFRAARTHETEKVFVYVADNFYLNGKAPWTDKRFLVLLEKKVSIYRSSLLGCIAPDLAMETIDGKQINLMSIKAQYTLIYFWSPDCNVCQNETEKLHVLYKKMKNNDLEIFAVYVHVDKVIWENYVKEKKLEWINVYDPLLKTDFAKLYNIQSTPELFLLDKDKKIIAKQINVGQLEKILSQKINNP